LELDIKNNLPDNNRNIVLEQKKYHFHNIANGFNRWAQYYYTLYCIPRLKPWAMVEDDKFIVVRCSGKLGK
jgi:hypothetical protein